MLRREVWTKAAKVVAFVSKVVVNDIQDYRKADVVRGVDQPLESCGAAITCLHCIRRNAVVSPVTLARKGSYRHDLDCGDTKIFKIRQPLAYATESATWTEGPNMQFVDNVLRKCKSAPMLIGPGKCVGIYDLSRSVNALGQKTGNWIGNGFVVIQLVQVSVARPC